MSVSRPPMDDARDERRLTLALFAVAWGANQFTPLLLVYRQRFGFGPAVLGGLWGCYAVGLVPGLLLGGAASDRRGRRPVVVPFFFLSLLATGVLIAGAVWSPALALGRLVAGVVSGVVFGAGSAWLVELSAALHTRRAALAVTAGFCLGPLAAGLIADAFPCPAVLPYLPHLALMAAALPGVLSARETLRPGAHARRAPPSAEVRRRFRWGVAPVAPFVFASVAVAFVVLPTRFGPLPHPVALVGLMTGATLGTGAAIQSLGRRLEAGRPGRAAVAGLAVATLGWAVAAWTARAPGLPGVLASMGLLGSAYGLCLVGGLSAAGRLADGGTRGTLVGWFYAWAYLGFGAPFLVAWLAQVIDMPRILLGGSAIAALATVTVARELARWTTPSGRSATAPSAAVRQP
ncbi:MAG TPA: MFS transporter [Myxococcaceae bacterium]|nr:MFS transporter [Myxococcaceae bacterium]